MNTFFLLEHWEAHDIGRATQNWRHKLNLRPRWVPRADAQTILSHQPHLLLSVINQPVIPSNAIKSMLIFTHIYSKNSNFIFSHSWSNSGSWCTKDYNTGCWAEIYHEDYWSGPWTGIPCPVNNKLVQRWTIFRAFRGINWFLMCFYKLYKPSLKKKKKKP